MRAPCTPKRRPGGWVAGLLMSSVLVTSVGAPALAQTFLPPTSFAHEQSDLAADPAVVWGRLSNGMAFAILRNETPKETVSLRLRIAAGALMENEDQRGLAHFLEHMAFNGSQNVPEGEMVKLLQREGLAFGPDTNAYTSWDETVYQLDLPKPGQLELGLKIMRETADRLLMSPSAIDKERGVVQAEERVRATPGYRAFEAQAAFLGAGTRIPLRMPIGKVEVLQRAPRQAFVDFYQGYYTPKRAFLVVVGDVSVDQVRPLIETAFASWQTPPSPLPDPQWQKPQIAPGAIGTYVEKELPTSLSLNAVVAFEDEPDNSATRRKQTLRALANAVVSRRLEKIARSSNAPIQSGSAACGDWFRTLSYCSIDASATPQTWEKALATIDLELRRALAHGFTQAEFAQELADYREGYARAAAQAATRRTQDLAAQLVGTHNEHSVFTSPAFDLAWFDQIAPSLNRQDAHKVFVGDWGTRDPAVWVQTSEAIKGGEAAIGEALKTSRAREAIAPVEEASVAFAYTDFGKAGLVTRRAQIADLGISSLRFANGVRVNMKQTDFEDDRIRVRVRFGRGLAAMPASQPGLSGFVGAAFVAGGLGKHDISDIERALAGRTIGLQFSADTDAFEFAAATSPQDLQLQLQVLAAYFADPAFRADGFDRYKGFKDAIYKQTRATPGAVLQTEQSALLRSGDGRFAFPTPAQFDAVTLDQVKAVLQPALASGAIEIIVVGDIDPAAVESAIANTFGAFGKRPPAGPLRLSERFPARPAAKPILLTHDGRPDQTIAAIWWPTNGYRDGRTARQLRILEQVLNNRLTDVVREDAGATYSPGTDWFASTETASFGYIGANLELTPDKTASFLKKVEEVAAELAAGGITQDQFDRARKPLIANIEKTLRENGWWSNWMAGIDASKDRQAILRGALSHYRDATLADVNKLAKQYLNAKSALRVMVQPTQTPEQAPTTGAPGQ